MKRYLPIPKPDALETFIHGVLQVAAVLAVLTMLAAMARVNEQAPGIAQALFPRDHELAGDTTGAHFNVATNRDASRAIGLRPFGRNTPPLRVWLPLHRGHRD